MRKRIKKRKFGRNSDQRRALLKSLASNLILRERIETSLSKAKEVRPLVERLITRSKEDGFNTARYLEARLDKRAAEKARKVLGKRFEKRPGGYLRIIKTISNRHDHSPMAIIEFVGEEQKEAVVKEA